MADRVFFEGWYFKHQCGRNTLALIAAHHRGRTGRPSASLQVLLPEQAFHLDIPITEFYSRRHPFLVRIGGCTFHMEGCQIDCQLDGKRLTGELQYRDITPLRGDIMGPFRYVPGMQCRHSVFSLTHEVEGRLYWDGQPLDFHCGSGYVEGDRGRSFPRRYLWTQCGWEGNSLMLSVADIPFCGSSFVGCICAVLLDGEEYRLATYYGARVLKADRQGAVIRQRELELQVRLESGTALPLRAPQDGGMVRTIYESAACRVRYLFSQRGRTLFDRTEEQASFEADWPEAEPEKSN